MSGEEWRPVPGYPGYEASDFGGLRSLRRGVPCVMKARPGTDGYPKVTVKRDGRKVTVRLHALITRAFLGTRPGDLQVRHIDGDKTNNAIANLVYGTTSENAQDQVRHGRHRVARRTSCSAGHAYTAETTKLTAAGHRRCRICDRAAWKRKNERRKAPPPQAGSLTPLRRGAVPHLANGAWWATYVGLLLALLPFLH